jgi:hypothetical protein
MEWISLKLMKPEKPGFYYVWKRGTRYGLTDQADVCHFSIDFTWLSGAGYEVTHWQEITPPKI